MRPEQQSPKEVKVDMSMHWPPEATHDSVVVVVGLVVEIIGSQVPNGGVQLMPEQQSPRGRKLDMSMHWAPAGTHSVVAVVGFVVVVTVDSQVPNGGWQLRPEQQTPKGRKLDMSMHWAPEARQDSVVIVVGASDVARGPQTPIIIVFPSKCGLQLRPEQQ